MQSSRNPQADRLVACYEVLGRSLIIETNHEQIADYISNAYRDCEQEPDSLQSAPDVGRVRWTQDGCSLTLGDVVLEPLNAEQSATPFAAAFYGSSLLFRAFFRKNLDYHSVYGAAVRVGDRAILLTGETASGKTTLAIELLDRGATYYGDEYAFIKRVDRNVRGFRRTMMIRENTLNLVKNAKLRELREQSASRSIGSDRIWDFVNVEDVYGRSIWAEPAPLGAVFLIERHPSQPVSVERVSAAIAAVNLLPRFNHDETGFARAREICSVLEELPCFHLCVGDPSDTASAILEALG